MNSKSDEKFFKKHNIVCVRPLDDILPFLGEGASPITVDCRKYSMSSNRLLTYKKGTDCVFCKKVKGEFFAVRTEHRSKSWRLDLYGRNIETNELMMMTSDHIIPLSKGGKNELNNRQPMCEACNQLKSDIILTSLDYSTFLEDRLKQA